MKYIIFACLFLCGQLVLGQTGDVRGKVQLADGKAVHGATITILGSAINGISSANGLYHLKSLPFGKYDLSVTSIEIEPFKQTIYIDQATQQLNLVVHKKESIDLDEVAIVGTTTKQKIENSGFAVNIIDTKEAAVRNLQTNELLDRTVGVRVRQNGGLGAQVDYNLNGMSGRAVGVFIDGIEISTYGSSFNLSNIPPALIERIEVYKGVIPAHLSGDLLGGAINVVLKNDASQNSLSVSSSYGSFNTAQSDVSGMYRNNKNGLTIKGAAFYSYSDNDYEVWGKFARNTLPDGTMEQVRAKRFFDAYRSYGGRFELGFTQVNWADRFMFSYNGSDTYNEIQHGQYMSNPYMGRFSQSQAHVFSLNYAKRDFLTKGLEVMINGVYSDRNQFVQDTVSWNYNWSGEKMIGFHGLPLKTSGGAQQGAPTMNTINRNIATMRANLSYELFQGHKIALNHMYYMVDRYEADEIRHVLERKYQSTSDLYKNVSSFSYEAELLNKSLRSSLFLKHYQQGIRVVSPHQEMINGEAVYVEDIIENSKNAFGYGLAMSYAASQRIMLIGSAERAIRMPAEQEVFGGPAENIVANPTLKPEVSDNINLGLKIGSLDFDAHRFTFTATAFVRNTKDKISRKAETRLVNEAVEVVPYVNLGLAQSIGFESSVHYLFNNKLAVNFSLSKFSNLFKQEFDPETGLRLDAYYNKQLPNEPSFTMNSSVQYSLTNVFQKASTLQLHYNFGYVDPFNMIWIKSASNTTPRQFSQDVGASYRFPNKKLVASLDVKNLLNAEVYDNFAVQKPGRAFYFKLNYTINSF